MNLMDALRRSVQAEAKPGGISWAQNVPAAFSTTQQASETVTANVSPATIPLGRSEIRFHARAPQRT